MTPTSETYRPLRIGLGIALVVLVGFGLITTQVLGPSPLYEYDKDVAQAMRDYSKRERNFGWLMVGLTTAGGVLAMTLLSFAGAIWGGIRRQPWMIAAWVLIPAIGGLMNLGLKVVLDRERPPVDWRDPFVDETNESFPSGHAMGSTIGFGLLGYTLFQMVKSRPKRWLIGIGLALLVLGVGFSRVYLRAHWFSDVVAGFLVGIAWLGISLGTLEVWRRRRAERDPPLEA